MSVRRPGPRLPKIPIEEITIDAAGRLLVRPVLKTGTDFAFIYRAAVGVNWDPRSASLVAPKPKEWSYIDWFRNIIAAVRSEYGDQLTLSSETEWSNVPSDLRQQIERSAAALNGRTHR